MRRSATTIVGLGIVTALFLALMSMFYLQQIPTIEDLKRIDPDLRREHGLYLTATDPIVMALIRPGGAEHKTGVHLTCTLRPDIQKRPSSVANHLDRLAQSVLDHPDLKGRIGYVVATHPPPAACERTVRPGRAQASR